MSVLKVTNYLKKYNKDKDIIIFDDSSATVELAAKRLNCDPNLIAKSLTFYGNEGVILIVAAGNKKIDNAKFKSEFGLKAKMVKPEDLLSLVGHPKGGVCPFAVNDNVNVYLDVSLKEYEYVYPACGSENSAIKLSIDELNNISKNIKWVDVCKN